MSTQMRHVLMAKLITPSYSTFAKLRAASQLALPRKTDIQQVTVVANLKALHIPLYCACNLLYLTITLQRQHKLSVVADYLRSKLCFPRTDPAAKHHVPTYIVPRFGCFPVSSPRLQMRCNAPIMANFLPLCPSVFCLAPLQHE